MLATLIGFRLAHAVLVVFLLNFDALLVVSVAMKLVTELSALALVGTFCVDWACGASFLTTR